MEGCRPPLHVGPVVFAEAAWIDGRRFAWPKESSTGQSTGTAALVPTTSQRRRTISTASPRALDHVAGLATEPPPSHPCACRADTARPRQLIQGGDVRGDLRGSKV